MNPRRHLPLIAVVLALSCGCSLGKPAGFKPQEGGGGAAVAQIAQDPAGALTAELPTPEQATETAPETFRARFKTTKGDFVVEVTREWAPNGADRFYNLVKLGYFRDIAVFRAIDGFMFQFGIHGDPAMNKLWADANIPDDPGSGQSNLVGYLTYAHAGPNTRGTQMFVNLGNNSGLDRDFPPIGKVVEGMEVVAGINTEYGENPRYENIQGLFTEQGNAYIKERFPNLDYITEVVIDDPNAADAEAAPVDPAAGQSTPPTGDGGAVPATGDGG